MSLCEVLAQRAWLYKKSSETVAGNLVFDNCVSKDHHIPLIMFHNILKGWCLIYEIIRCAIKIDIDCIFKTLLQLQYQRLFQL